MDQLFHHARRLVLSHAMEKLLRLTAWRNDRKGASESEDDSLGKPLPENPVKPEDFRPLENACFQDPYAFYKMLRDDYPVYQLPNGIFCISRFEDIKQWCVHGIASQSGISSAADLMRSRAASLAFIRYCWHQYLIAKRQPRDDLSRIFVNAACDPDNQMTDQLAVSAIFQLLIAGSDSSATSMGNALKVLIDHPELADEIRGDIENKLPAFVEEVFRMETAFQGHFRWTKNDTELHGVKLPGGSRIFLMWASGNRDERMFENANAFRLDRKNGKKHLTFGHGIHACIGRELARAEIRIVLREFLLRTKNLRLDGEAPFLASMFARTLVQLPVAFDSVDDKDRLCTDDQAAA